VTDRPPKPDKHPRPRDSALRTPHSALLYVAYPMRLDLGAANAIQTYNTVRELRRVLPGTRLVVPRWLLEKSAFTDLDAIHLPRPAINKLSRLLPWAGWSYIERTLYAWMLVILLMLRRITRKGYRALYVRDAVCAAWLASLRPLHGACVIYEVHDLEAAHPSKANRWPSGLWSRLLPWLDQMALTRSHRLVSLTDTFRKWAGEQRVRNPRDIAVIPDAYDASLYRPTDPAAARTGLDLPHDAFIVGYAGLTFAYRRIDLLVEAFARFSVNCPSALLLLVGGRPQEVEEIRAQAGDLGISDKVLTTGQVDPARAALYMAASDVLAIPDTVTGMTASPLKLFEYMASGKPIVLKDMPALREILDDTSGLFFPEGDVDALARALAALYDDPDMARTLGQAALARSEGYTYRARAERIAEVVKSCL
jgi:glycosyltransferase involved in cell wall biosynthesis